MVSKTIGPENMKVKTVHGPSGVRELVCTLIDVFVVYFPYIHRMTQCHTQL